MRNAHSYEVITQPYGETEEHDRFQCEHCGCHKRLPPGRSTPEFTCKTCMGFICGHCATLVRTEGCRTQQAQLENLERAITRRLGWENNFRQMR